MRTWHVVGGAIALGLGFWGLNDEYFVVVEFLKGAIQPLLALIGVVAILAGMLSLRPRIGHVISGLVLLGLGIYGFYDEYFATLDFFKGALPPALLLVGMVSVVAGVKQLK
jgi:hypothetical protein